MTAPSGSTPADSTAAVFPKLREAAAHTVIYGVGSVLQTALGFILIPLYTRQFVTEEYGLFTLLGLVGTIAGSIFYLGMSSALARSYFDHPSEAHRAEVFSTALALTLLGALAQVGLGLALSDLVSRRLFGTDVYARHVLVALLGSAATFVNALFLILFRLQRRPMHVVGLNVLSFVGTTGLIVYFLVRLRLGVLAPLLGTVLGQLLPLAVAAAIQRRFIRIAVSPREAALQLQFGIPTVLAGLTYYVLDSLDRLFIQAFASLSDVGVYSLGYRVGMLIEVVFILPFGQFWGPMRMSYVHDEHAPQLFRLVLTYYVLVGTFLAAALAVFAPEIVALIGGRPEYFPAYRVVPFVALGHLAYGAIGVVDTGIILRRRVIYHVGAFAAGIAVNAGLNVVLVPRFGYMGAAYATLLTYAGVLLVEVVISNRLFKISWDPRRIGVILATGLGALALGTLIPPGVGGMGGVAKVALLAGIAAAWFRLVLTREEQLMARTLVGPRALLRRIRVNG